MLLTDAVMDRHASPGHPERPERRSAAARGARQAAADGLVERTCEPIADEAVLAVHDAEYVASLRSVEQRGGGWLDADTYVVPGSLQAAGVAAAATVEAARAATVGEVEVALAAVRPPGHHAARARGAGFCLINNVAVAVAALRRAGLARRVAIVDWDVHHGDGTQAIFDDDPDVCYASTHQWPFYPGTGGRSDRGVGAAMGTKMNRPLAAGSGDEEFLAAWRDDLLPTVEAFGPEAILVSAGYDAHRADPLASLAVTDAGFGELGHLTGALCARAGLPGVALTLEGGYDLDALSASVAATISGLLAGRRVGRAGA